MLLVSYALNAVRMLVLVDALSTWLLRESQFPRSLTNPILQPIYRPLRAVFGPYTGNVDISPLLVLIALSLIGATLRQHRGPR